MSQDFYHPDTETQIHFPEGTAPERIQEWLSFHPGAVKCAGPAFTPGEIFSQSTPIPIVWERATETPTSLFKGMTLRELCRIRVDGEGSEDPALLEYFETELSQALTDITKEKIDSYVAVIDDFTEELASIARMIEVISNDRLGRLYRKNERIQKQLDRLRERALEAMELSGKNELQGNAVSLRALGVAPSVDVYDESKVPDEFKAAIVTINLSAEDWNDVHGSAVVQEFFFQNYVDRIQVKYQPDKRALLAALKQPCPNCNGQVVITHAKDGLLDKCDKCNLTGLRQIPGAKLISNKKRLVVE